MTGRVSDNITCSTCKIVFPRSELGAAGLKKCPACATLYRRIVRQRNKLKQPKKKGSEEYKYCTNFGDAGLYC